MLRLTVSKLLTSCSVTSLFLELIGHSYSLIMASALLALVVLNFCYGEPFDLFL